MNAVLWMPIRIKFGKNVDPRMIRNDINSMSQTISSSDGYEIVLKPKVLMQSVKLALDIGRSKARKK